MHERSRSTLPAVPAMTAAAATGIEPGVMAWRLRVDRPLTFLVGH
jgi:hypothetical protein